MLSQQKEQCSPVWFQFQSALASLLGGSSGCSRRRRTQGVLGRTGGTRSEASLSVWSERRAAPVCPPPVWMSVWYCGHFSLISRWTCLTKRLIPDVTFVPVALSPQGCAPEGHRRARDACARGRHRCGSASDVCHLTNLHKNRHDSRRYNFCIQHCAYL